jgi:Pyridine nucleotide-disulphide oxidoreductase
MRGPARSRARPETKDPRAGGRTAYPAECDSRASAVVSVVPLPGSCAPSASGGGYIGLEMADALTVRGLAVTQIEQLAEVLPTVDPQLCEQVHAELAAYGVEVLTGTTVQAITRAAAGQAGRLQVQAVAADGTAVTRAADLVLVVAGVRPETALAAEAGATLGVRGAIAVDEQMRTNLPDVFAAGDCVVTHQAVKRRRTVRFDLSDEEFRDLSAAADRAGLACGAFSAQAALLAARSGMVVADSPLREALGEFVRAVGAGPPHRGEPEPGGSQPQRHRAAQRVQETLQDHRLTSRPHLPASSPAAETT